MTIPPPPTISNDSSLKFLNINLRKSDHSVENFIDICILNNINPTHSLTFSWDTSSGKVSLLGFGKSGNKVPPGAVVTHEFVP